MNCNISVYLYKFLEKGLKQKRTLLLITITPSSNNINNSNKCGCQVVLTLCSMMCGTKTAFYPQVVGLQGTVQFELSLVAPVSYSLISFYFMNLSPCTSSAAIYCFNLYIFLVLLCHIVSQYQQWHSHRTALFFYKNKKKLNNFVEIQFS